LATPATAAKPQDAPPHLFGVRSLAISPDGSKLAFYYQGDIWVGSTNGGKAEPITTNVDLDDNPVWSPDSKRIAFSSNRNGNNDIYVVNADGGAPKRLTFHPSTERPLAFTADGAQVIYRSDRANPLGRTELWSVPVVGGPSKPLGIGEGSLASVDAATGRMAFTPWSNENWSWKRYRGGTAPDLWIADAERKNFTRLTKTPENELFPMWLRTKH
jgi:tricorn protease